MPYRNILRLLNPFLFLLLILAFPACITIQVPMEPNAEDRDNLHININVHSPSMIEENGRFYMFHSGRGIANWVSRDRINWIRLNPIFESVPEWTKDALPGFKNDIRSPNISVHNSTYYLYYTVSSYSSTTSAIGLVTNETLAYGDPEYEWIDHGIVIQAGPRNKIRDVSSTTLTFDENRNPWLVISSNKTEIYLVGLEDDLKTVKVTPEKNKWPIIASQGSATLKYDCEDNHPISTEILEQPVENGAIESPLLLRKKNYYYLLITSGRNCNDNITLQKIVVGRSQDITGPYLDKEGENMVHGGGSLVIEGDENYAGIGHQSAYTFNGTDYLVAHGYDLNDEFRAKLIILEMTWDENDWPVVNLYE